MSEELSNAYDLILADLYTTAHSAEMTSRENRMRFIDSLIETMEAAHYSHYMVNTTEWGDR